MRRIDVGVLGATGMVGQQFALQLAEHPWFSLTWLAASERPQGRKYRDAAPRRLSTPIPTDFADKQIDGCVPGRGPKVLNAELMQAEGRL
jgi:aspartate-semialdehyde dehydrogenase